jgi:choline kinase
MKAIILAAGKGSRISDAIGAVPKSTLEINGKSIIRSTTEMLLARGIEVSICVGYRHQLIRKSLEGLTVRYYYNPFYDVTNNIASLWFAQNEIDGEDILVMSADVVISEEVLDRIIHVEGDLIMVTDSSRVNDGDYFFHIDAMGNVQEYGPDIAPEKRDCEYVGLSKIGKEYATVFKTRLNDLIEEGKNSIYMEFVFFSFIGLVRPRLSTIDIHGLEWREIDFMEDYQKAISQFEK